MFSCFCFCFFSQKTIQGKYQKSEDENNDVFVAKEKDIFSTL